MQISHNDDFNWEFLKVIGLWFGTLLSYDFHVIAGNVFLILSISYLVWKWRYEIHKAKREKELHQIELKKKNDETAKS